MDMEMLNKLMELFNGISNHKTQHGDI